MNIFDLKNDLPDEMMASTSTLQTTTAARNNFRVIPSADGNINKFWIRCEPMSSAAAPVSTATSVQPEASSSSSEPLVTAVNPSTRALQRQNRFHPISTFPSQSRIVTSSILTNPSVIYPAGSSQSATISSSSFLPQSQNNQPAHFATSSEPLPMPSSSLLTQTSQGVFSTSSTQPTTVSSSAFSLQSQINQRSFFNTPSTFMPTSHSNLPPARNSALTSTSLSYFKPPSQSNQPAYPAMSSTYGLPATSRNDFPPSHSIYGTPIPSFTQTNPPAYAQAVPLGLQRRLHDMNRRWLAGNRTQTPTGIVLPTQPTTLTSSSRSSVSPNGTITPRSTLVQRQNQNPFASVQNTTSTENVSSPNGDPDLAPASAQQNAATNATKEWQKSFNQECRKHLIKRLVQSMFPSTSLITPMSSTAQNCRLYVEKMEREIYETANSKGEYYHLMAEKHYKIFTEMEKKRQTRKAQLLQQQKQQSQNSQQDTEMAPLQSSDEAVRALDSNSNVSNQSLGTISYTSIASSLVNNLLKNNQKTFTKEWHKQIGAELREILVKEFVQKIHPALGTEAVINNPEESSATIDERIKSHVKNVECDIYQKADSRIEYYELLADRFCKIQEELRKCNFAILENS